MTGNLAGEAGLPGNAACIDAELGRNIGHRGVLQVIGGALAQRMVFTLTKCLHD